jgi:hypothetical protein
MAISCAFFITARSLLGSPTDTTLTATTRPLQQQQQQEHKHT